MKKNKKIKKVRIEKNILFYFYKWVHLSEKDNNCQQPQNCMNGSESLVCDRVSFQLLEIYLILKLNQ